MSGSAFSSWALVEEPVIYALKLAKELNCTIPEDLIKDHESIVDCLRDVPLEELFAAEITPPNFLSAFGPSVDGVVIRPGRSNQDIDESSRASKRNQATGAQFDLMISVVTGEALWRFSASDIQSGFVMRKKFISGFYYWFCLLSVLRVTGETKLSAPTSETLTIIILVKFSIRS